MNVIPCKALADSTTALTFWYCDEDDALISCDALELMQQSNVYAVVFHMLLASMLNCSTFIINNTVNARTVDEIKKCLALHSKIIENGVWINEEETKQIIVVDQNAVSNTPFFDGRFKRITCNHRNGRRGFQIITEN